MGLIEMVRAGNDAEATPEPSFTSAEMQAAESWLSDFVISGAKKEVVRKVRLSPALAAALLRRNPNNRRVLKSAVSSMARDMRNGAWVFTGQPIIVSRDGFLNDGQHRCSAVVESGVTVDVLVVAGTDRESRYSIDTGRVRTSGDFLGMEGFSNTVLLGAAISNVLRYKSHQKMVVGGSTNPTRSEVLRFPEDHPEIIGSVAKADNKSARLVGGPSLIAAMHFLLAEASHVNLADEFVMSLMDGENLTASSPVLYARNRLIAEHGRRSKNECAELIIRAWNAWRAGEEPKTLQILNDRLPEISG